VILQYYYGINLLVRYRKTPVSGAKRDSAYAASPSLSTLAYVPAIPLFCRILTTTRRSSACPSAVASDATC
jgi:hypothetical protein